MVNIKGRMSECIKDFLKNRLIQVSVGGVCSENGSVFQNTSAQFREVLVCRQWRHLQEREINHLMQTAVLVQVVRWEIRWEFRIFLLI